jgi:iron(III) transport system ATP-binding protein
MRVQIDNLGKRFGTTPVLQQVCLTVEDHELFFLLGPSGCGKTTLLRLLAGFYQPDEGQIHFGNKNMNGVPPNQRHTGMVFQNYALWPHLSVAENVGYGLEIRGLNSTDRKNRVREALSVVQMESFADRSPNQLSGGQQQRIALARALVIQPDVLLLDEPLSNLDAKLRLEMREEIRRIHAHTRITTVYVTHDQKEALSLADRLAVMRAGAIEQIGTPRDLYRSPANRFVADFMGEINWLSGTVINHNDSTLHLKTDFGPLHALPQPQFLPGQPVSIGIRPEAIQIGSAPENSFNVTVERLTYLGDIEEYYLRLGPDCLLKSFEQNPLQERRPGHALTIHVAPHDLLVLNQSGENHPDNSHQRRTR